MGPGVANLLSIFQAFSDWTDEQMRSHFSGMRYGDLKKQVARWSRRVSSRCSSATRRLRPIPLTSIEILREGAERVMPIANSTVELVKSRMGLYTRS